MGALTLQIGALSRSISAPDDKMTNVLTEVIEATNGPVGGAPSQQADHVLAVIRQYLMEVANGHRRRKAIEEAEAEVDSGQLDLD